jgi:hypothetical protein
MQSIVSVACILVAACGSSSGSEGGVLTCGWVESNNCWKQTVEAAVSCLPPASEIGVLSADAMSCTYASGDVVTSTLPLAPQMTPPQFNFTVTTGAGAECLHWESGQGSVVVTTSAGTVTDAPDATSDVMLTCPDGAVFTADQAQSQALLACGADGGISALPGHRAQQGTSGTSAHAEFWVDGTSAGALQIFNCQN